MLNSLNYEAGAISRKTEFGKCRETMDSFESGTMKTVISTPGFIRALSTPNLKALIVFELPTFSANGEPCFDESTYVQIISRVGRLGKNAIIFNLFTNEESYALQKFHSNLGIKSIPL